MNAMKTGAQRASSNLGSGSTHRVDGAAKFHSAGAYNASGSTVYLQLHDSATTPAAGAVPCSPPVKIEDTSVAFGTQFLDWGDSGRPLVNGLAVVLSSTAATYTAVAGDFIIDITYS